MNKQIISDKILICILFFIAIPFIAMILFSFLYNSSEGYTISSNGFKELLLNVRLEEIGKIALRSLIVSVTASVIAYCISYLLVMFSSVKFQTLFLTLITLPFLANEAVRVFSWQNILAENGVLNNLISFFTGTNSTFFNSSNGANIYITMIFSCIPFAIFICTGTLKIVPEVYWKVSNDLRLNPINKFLKVALPLSINAILASILITFFVAFALSSEVSFLGGATKISTRGFILSLMSANRYQAIFAFGFTLITVISIIYLFTFLIAKNNYNKSL